MGAKSTCCWVAQAAPARARRKSQMRTGILTRGIFDATIPLAHMRAGASIMPAPDAQITSPGLDILAAWTEIGSKWLAVCVKIIATASVKAARIGAGQRKGVGARSKRLYESPTFR
jgi:hypothetical protein